MPHRKKLAKKRLLKKGMGTSPGGYRAALRGLGSEPAPFFNSAKKARFLPFALQKPADKGMHVQ